MHGRSHGNFFICFGDFQQQWGVSMGLPLVRIYDTGLVLPHAAPPRPLSMDDPLLSMLVTEQLPTPLSFSPPLESMKTMESSSKTPWALYILSSMAPFWPSAPVSSVSGAQCYFLYSVRFLIVPVPLLVCLGRGFVERVGW